MIKLKLRVPSKLRQKGTGSSVAMNDANCYAYMGLIIDFRKCT